MLEIPDEKDYNFDNWEQNPKVKEQRITMTNSIASIKANQFSDPHINQSANGSYRHNRPIHSNSNEIAVNFKEPLKLSPKKKPIDQGLNQRSHIDNFISKISF